MAHNPVFEESRIGGYDYDQVENLFSDFPQVSASGQVNMDHDRFGLGTFYDPQYTRLLGGQQSPPEVGSYPDTGFQYNQTWGPVGSNSQERQWPALEASHGMDRLTYDDRYQRELNELYTAPFSHLPSPLLYDGFADPRNRGDFEYSVAPRKSKRLISEVDGDDDADHSSSSVQMPAFKRQRRTSETNLPGTAAIRRCKQPKPLKKRKTVKRPARKDRIQGTKGAEHNPKGMTRISPDGHLEWRETEESNWGSAGYHNDYRAELIALDEVEGESYDQEPAGGGETDPLNITSYCALQRHWTANKASVLDGQHRWVLHMLEPPEDWVHNPKVAPMKHGEMVMLDQDGFPVRDFPGVPKVLSTHIEPFRLEGLRRCTGMTIPDFRARMPSHRMKGAVVTDLQTPQAFTNRMNHWRIAENVGAWLERDGSQQIKDYIKDQLPDPELKTTESLSSLNSAQRKKVYGLNKGQYLNKSRYEQAPEEVSASPSEGRRQTADTGYRRKRVRRDDNGSLPIEGEQPTYASANVARPSRRHKPSRQDPVASSAAVAPQTAEPDDGVANDIDIRFWTPNNATQAASIQAALYYTRADYAYWLREQAPVTPAFESYVAQFMQLQGELSSRWDPVRGEEPTLMGLGPWFGGWNMWQQPAATEEQFSRLLPGA